MNELIYVSIESIHPAVESVYAQELDRTQMSQLTRRMELW